MVQIPHVIQSDATPSTPMTPRHGSAQGTTTQVAAQPTTSSTPRGNQTPSSILSRSTSTDLVKTRSLCEIYDVDTSNSFSLCIISQIDDPRTFEEVVKDEVLAQAMDE